jgi:site-specific DNA-methyltransferase (adenine-specific)
VWYYKKLIASNFASAKYQPMKHIEDVCVFTKNGGVVNYYPIMQERAESGKKRLETPYWTNSQTSNETMGNMTRNNAGKEYDKEVKFPENMQTFNNRAKGARGFHPTQKPIELMEYLIKSHTKENDLVLDFTMGSGTTGVACKNLNRNFIGIELEEKYFNIAEKRINESK